MVSAFFVISSCPQMVQVLFLIDFCLFLTIAPVSPHLPACAIAGILDVNFLLQSGFWQKYNHPAAPLLLLTFLTQFFSTSKFFSFCTCKACFFSPSVFCPMLSTALALLLPPRPGFRLPSADLEGVEVRSFEARRRTATTFVVPPRSYSYRII